MAVVQQFMAYIQEDVLLSTDSHPAAGLTYHLADVYVVELIEVSQSRPPSAAVLAALLAPFCQVLARSNRAAFLPRLRYGPCLTTSCEEAPMASNCMMLHAT